MIELRWITWEDEELYTPERIQFGAPARTRTVVKKKLQYRQLVDKNVYAGFNRPDNVTPNMQWSDWRDVPEVPDIDPGCP